MKSSIRISIAFSCLFLFTGNLSFAQCIDKFPYTQDFEKFQSISSTTSCTTTEKGDTADGWTQDQSDNGEWRADSSGTPSYLTGPGSTFGTTGSGTGKDYRPGKTDGIYLYTESSTNTCGGGDISILSPCFDFSGSKSYRLTFGYHMHGGGIGSLHIDVLDSNVWVKDVWQIHGHQGANWNTASVILAPFTKSGTQIRIRAKMGDVWSSDIAIDGVKVEAYTPLKSNISIVQVIDTAREFYSTTKLHTDNTNYLVRIKNNGSTSANSIVLKAASGSWSHTQSIGALAAYNDTTINLSSSFRATSSAQKDIRFTLTMTQADGDTSDNSAQLKTGFSDSIFARDNGLAAGAIGLTAAGEMGQTLEVKTSDTLTGVRFFLVNPVSGDSVRVQLYEFSAGRPGNLMATSKHVILSGSGWYRLNFDCDQPLSAGEYLITVSQTSANNMGLGSTIDAFKPNSTMYGFGTTWTNLSGGTAPYPYALMIRMVFGERHRPTPVITSNDSICEKQKLIINASGGDTYEWGPANKIKFPKNQSTVAESSTSFTLSLKTWDACGIPSFTVTKPIKVNKIPTGVVSPDTVICEGESVTLTAQGGTNYSWSGGPKNKSWTFTPTSTESYIVIIDSTNGCRLILNTRVGVQKLNVRASNDTTICSGTSVELSATGATTYAWTPTGSGAKNTVTPLINTQYIVTGTSSIGCSDTDTVEVKVNKAPDLKVPHDTIVCFGRRFDFEASGADSFQWKDGPSTAKYNVLPILSKWFYVAGINKNGCTATDSVHMLVASVPRVNLREDTIICEKTSLTLEALTSNKVEFIWSTGDTSKSIQVNPIAETTYKVLVKNDGNCQDSAEVTIGLDPLPSIDINFSITQGKTTFSNKTKDADEHKWVFGDGEESADKSPFHKYQDTGTYTITYTATNKCGPVDTTFQLENYWVGVPHVGLNLAFRVYPQPADKNVRIELAGKNSSEINIKLFDMSGKMVLQQSNQVMTDGSYLLDLSALATGGYLLHVTNEFSTGRKMLLVK
jgi:hypothetical protein